MDQLEIKSAQGNYQVYFTDNVRDAKSQFDRYEATHFIIDRKVYEAHQQALDSLINGSSIYFIEATEETKTLAGVAELSTWLQGNGANRSSRLVAIGGGITQDLVTFTSHVYYRGIPWLFFPTTLLSMCDSSIGAKCGINLNEFKNQLGVFQSPHAVFTCMQFLESLPDFHISSGYGEILKLYLTGGDWDLLENLQSALQSGLRTPNLRELIKTSLKIKKGIIERDEYESDLRRVLNYGHTFGHSLEKVTNHEIPHGLAVAWGMDLINFIAVKRNLLSERRFLEIREVIKNKLPFQLRSSVSPEDLIEGARKDKKTDKTGVNLIFLNDLGSLEIKKVSFDERLFQEISDYLKNHNVYAGR